MLNVVDHRTAGLPPGEARFAAERAILKRQGDEFARCTRVPYTVVAWLLGAVYAGALLLAGAILRLAGRRPDPLARSLAEAYVAVPEMALHKVIEIRALARQGASGLGLDLGCGDGIVGGLLAREAGWSHLHGCDVNLLNRAALAARGYSGYFAADIQRLPVRAGAYDFVVSVCVIEHVPDLASVLAEAARVLRPGGVLTFTTPSPGFRTGLFVYRLLRRLGFAGAAARFQVWRDLSSMQYHYLTREEWQGRLAALGFEEIRVQPLFTRGQLAAYEIMNAGVYAPRFSFYHHLAAWCRWSPFRRALAGALGAIVTGAASEASDPEGTHWVVTARRAEETQGPAGHPA